MTATGAAPRILVIEDDPSIAHHLVLVLRRLGFAPRSAPTAGQGLAMFERWEPDAVVLDLMLPDRDGRDLCRDLRAASSVPIVIVSARADPLDRVVGLELGADDYVVKPFSSAELAARITAVLRRAQGTPSADPIEIGDVRIDPVARSVTKAGQARHLTAREFDVLHMLAANAGRVVRREAIMDALWGTDRFGSTRTLNVHVARIREGIEDDPRAPRYVLTVRGVGFRFATAPELAA
jgi:two-component system response regulator RegX3